MPLQNPQGAGPSYNGSVHLLSLHSLSHSYHICSSLLLFLGVTSQINCTQVFVSSFAFAETQTSTGGDQSKHDHHQNRTKISSPSPILLLLPLPSQMTSLCPPSKLTVYKQLTF